MKRRRLIIASAATVVILAPLVWLWAASLMPGQYSVMTMGYMDYGGGAHRIGSDAGREPVDVTTLIADPGRQPDVTVRLVARKASFRIPGGPVVDGYTLNGHSPGPVIHAVQGQLIQVTLVNESVSDGVTLHWHGVNVPNAVDGVAGVTQNAVPVGGTYVYRFVARQVGTFWYHSHQISHVQVKKGLIGALVIEPKDAHPSVKDVPVKDVPALVHIYGGKRTINGSAHNLAVDAEPGDKVRVRVINTDNGPMPVWVSGAPYRLVAVDGTDLNKPQPTDRAVLVTAGGRADILVQMPADGSGVRVETGGNEAVALGDEISRTEQPHGFVDMLTYGSPAPIGFDPADADRRFVYDIGRRPGFLDGRPGFWWTINGHLFPDVPMFMVAEGDIVQIKISNHSGDVHPMHLHGHHAVVLSRGGEPSTGSPWWIDTLNVADGETYVIAFLADNPGIWMDHCHNLPHATQGMVSHLMYIGVTTPYMIGGEASNQPA